MLLGCSTPIVEKYHCHDVGIDFQVRNPAWWHIPVITALRRLRQEDH